MGNFTAETLRKGYQKWNEEKTKKTAQRTIPRREVTAESLAQGYNARQGSNAMTTSQNAAYTYAMNHGRENNPSIDTQIQTYKQEVDKIQAIPYDRITKTDVEKMNAYSTQLKKLAEEKELIEQQAKIDAYNNKKTQSLGSVSEDGLKLLDAYNSSKLMWENSIKYGDMSLTGEQTMHSHYDAMSSARETLMKQYGISAEEFEKMAQYRKENTDAKAMQTMHETIAQNVKTHPVAAGVAYTALDIATSPVHGLMAAEESLRRLGYADKEAPVNTNSMNYMWQNFAQATEQAVNEEIDSDLGRFAYNVGVSTGKAGMAALAGAGVTGALGLTGKSAQIMGEIVTLPMFGTSSYASTLQADQEKGISTEKATAHAVASGLSEMLTELLPLDNLWNMAGSAGKVTAKQTIMNILKQAGMEGAEEGIASVANRIADDIINGSQSDYNMSVQQYISEGMSEEDARKQASWDFYGQVAQDVLAGMVSGGVMGGGATIAGKISYNELGVEVNSNPELKAKVVEAAMTMDDTTTAKEIVSKKDVKELTNSDTAKILESMDGIKGNEAVYQVREQIVEYTQKRAEMRHAEDAETQNTASETKTESNYNSNAASQPVAQSGNRKKYTTAGNALINASAQPVIAVQLENITNNEATVRIDNPAGGEQIVKLSEITMQDETKQQLYNFASKMDTAKVGNAVINNYSGEPIDTYAEACAVFYYGGKLGTSSFEQLISNPKNTRLAAGVADISTLKLMYEMGVNNRSQKNTEVAPVQRKTENKQAGKVTDNRTNKSDNRMKEVAEVVAKRTGLEITLNDNLEYGENGHFQQALSRIALSETSQNQFETLVHELNEFAGTYNPEGMKKVMDAVLDYAQSKEGAAYLTKRVQQYQDAYKQVESDKTYEGAAEEFVFDYLAGVFSQKEGVESFVQFMEKENMPETEQKNIINTVTDFFKQLFHKISAYLEEHMMSDTARRGLEADAQKAKEIREMVLEVWEGAIEESKVTKSVSGGKRLSINVDIDAEIKSYGVETKFNDYIGMQKGVVSALRAEGFFDKNVVTNEETGMQIAITAKGIKETLGSGNRFQTLPRDLKRLKVATIRALPEIIEKGRLIEDNVGNIHGNEPLFAYFVTPIKIQGEEVDVKVSVKKSTEANKFWIHNVIIEKSSEQLNPDLNQDIHELGNFSKNSKTQNNPDVNKKYSIAVDSLGNKLTKEQIRYFEKSKVRDENGKLKVMYHGTPNGDFTIFREGTYFTEYKWYADRYQSQGASSLGYKKTANEPNTYEVYLNITKPFDTRNAKERAIFEEEYYGQWGMGTPLMESGLPDWLDGEDLIEFLQENGYDYNGLILDEGGVGGYGDEVKSRGLSYVVFNPNQVKNIDNLNPTDNPDIRYSINIDDSLFNALEDTYSEQEQGDASIVQQGFEALKNVSVDEKLMSRIAYAIKKDYQSAYDKEQLTENLTRVFAYLKDTQNVQYEDMVRIVREIAKPVLEQSTDINKYEKQMYDDFRDYFKGKKIALTEEQKAEVAHYFGSYENFRRMNFGSITFSDNGTSLDSLWSEICDNSYQMLDHYASVADQPILLMDLMNELKPAKRNIYGMNIDQASYDLALDIFRRFFMEQAQEKANAKVNEKTARLVKRQQEYRQRVNEEYRGKLERMKNSEAERRERLKEYYEDKIDDMKRSRDAALEHKDKQAAEQFAKQADRYVKLLGKVKQTNETMLKLKAAQRQNTVDRHRNEDIRKYRERIKRNASGIITYFNTNTDKRHVPEALKDAVAQFITSIDFVSERANPDSMAQLEWQASLTKLKDRLGNQKRAVEEGYEEIYNALMDRDSGDTRVSSLLNDMQNFIDENENVRVTDLGLRELKQLDEMMTALKRAITTVNQLYVNKRTNDVAQLGDASIAELEQKKDKKKSASKAVEMADNLLNVNMLDARSFFHTLGENAMSIYEGLRTGFSERVWLIREAQKYIEKILEGKNIYNWTGENAKVHTFIVNGKELRMTTGQIMSLYELKKRRQADIHMKVGGIIPTDFKSSSKSVELAGKEYGVGRKMIEHRVKGIPVTDYDVDMICNVLTAEQRQVADAMQQFLANNCAAWGNAASMKMYGYKRFGVKDYFPIKTDGMSVDTKDESKFFGTKNRGFTKETMKNASNALMVDDIFDVFTNHVTEMATYSTFTAPLMDAMKWFNYKQKSYNGKYTVQDNTVKSEINRVYGKEYLQYFQKLIKDINAESEKGIESQISDHMVSRMKAASVGANLRVAIQQPTAYIRAAAIMDPKYLTKAVFTKSGTKKAREHSAITQWKSWGYFDTSIGRSMKNVITGQDTLRNKIVEKSMWLAQLGDDFTWGYLWNACEAEIRDKRTELVYGSKEFNEAVAERFDEVVDQTQVVDTVLHRSHMMRSDNGAVQMATAFMSEPTKSYNLLMNAVRDVREGGGKKAAKHLGRVALAYVTTQTVNAAVTAIIDAMRDLDDDDDTFWENWQQAFSENVKDNMNPLGMLPYVKDVISILNGYDVSRLDMQGISKLVSAGQKMYKYATDEDYRKKHTWFSVAKSFVYGLSQVGGVPGYNLLRELEGIYHTVKGDFMGGIKRTNNRNYELMVDAYVDKDTESYEKTELELIEAGVDEATILSGIQSEMGERYKAGTIERSVVEEFMRTEKDMEEKDIFMKIRTWDYKKEYPEGEYNSGYAYLYHYLDAAFESGKVEDRQIIKDEIQLLLKNGVEKGTISARITDHFKSDYLEAKKNGNYASLKNLIISAYMMLGLTHEEANKKIDAWEEK